MTWDVFKAYRDYGGWEDISPFCLVVQTEAVGTILIKRYKPLEVGSDLWSRLTHMGYEPCSPNDRDAVFGRVTRVISKEDFRSFDLQSGDVDKIRAIGEFMCGVCMHGQWLGDMLVHLSGRPSESEARQSPECTCSYQEPWELVQHAFQCPARTEKCTCSYHESEEMTSHAFLCPERTEK